MFYKTSFNVVLLTEKKIPINEITLMNIVWAYENRNLD